MIICVCNNLNSQKVEEAIRAENRTPACVLAHHGKRFNCGRCRDEIGSMLKRCEKSSTVPMRKSFAAE